MQIAMRLRDLMRPNELGHRRAGKLLAELGAASRRVLCTFGFGSFSHGSLALSDHTVRPQKQRLGDRYAKCFGGLEVYDEFE